MFEPEEVIILERHHRLDDVVQTLQACGQWDLDSSPNGGIDTVELDADTGDAIDNPHDADCSDFTRRRPVPRQQPRPIVDFSSSDTTFQQV